MPATTKTSANLQSEIGAGDAIRVILGTYAKDLCSKQPLTMRHYSTQACRQIRSGARDFSYALYDLGPYLDYLPAAHQRLDAFVDALGNLIDEDALMKYLVKAEAEAPEELLEGIGLFIEERRQGLQGLRDGVLTTLAESELAALSKELEIAIQKPDLVGLSVLEMARQVVLTRLKEMQTRSVAMYKPFKTKFAHRLRISVRKLQHALDLFSPYLGTELAGFSDELTKFEARLGKLRNLDRKISTVSDWLVQRHKVTSGRTDPSPQWNAAMWLVNDLFARRPKQFRKSQAAGQELFAGGFDSRLMQYCQDRKV